MYQNEINAQQRTPKNAEMETGYEEEVDPEVPNKFQSSMETIIIFQPIFF